MDSSVSQKDQFWFLRVCLHVPIQLYQIIPDAWLYFLLSIFTIRQRLKVSSAMVVQAREPGRPWRLHLLWRRLTSVGPQYNSFPVTLLVPRILRWLLDFRKFCAPLSKTFNLHRWVGRRFGAWLNLIYTTK